MPWGKLDDQLHDNEKVWSFTDKEFRVWMYSISYCNKKRRRDPTGTLTQEAAEGICRLAGAPRKVIEGIVQKRGWDRVDGGYAVHDFPQYGPKTDDTATERQQRHRDKAARHGVTNADVTPMSRRDSRARMDPVPVPVPVPSTTDETVEVIHASTAGRMARVQAMARAVPKPGEPGAPDWPLWEAFASALGCPVPTSPSAKRKWSAPIWELHSDGVTPDAIAELVSRFDEDNDVPCTPQGVANQLVTLRVARRAKAHRNGRDEPRGFAGLREAFADLDPRNAMNALEGAL